MTKKIEKTPAAILAKITAGAKARQAPKLRDIATEFINEMGGVEGFVKAMLDEWRSCQPGSMPRVRIAELVSRGLKAVDDEKADIGKLPTEDVKRLVADALAQLKEDDDGDAAGPGEPAAEEADQEPEGSPP